MAITELTQLHVMETWHPKCPTKLSRVEKVSTLLSLVFFKEKRGRKLKSRHCDDGSPQREYISKEEAASHMVATESVFTTATISVFGKRYNRTFNIPGTFVNMDSDETVLVVLKNDMAEMMVKIAPHIYRKHITMNPKGRPILYVRLQRMLYGLLHRTLMFYRKLSGVFEADGFVVNLYDPCMANKMTGKGDQITVV